MPGVRYALACRVMTNNNDRTIQGQIDRSYVRLITRQAKAYRTLGFKAKIELANGYSYERRGAPHEHQTRHDAGLASVH